MTFIFRAGTPLARRFRRNPSLMTTIRSRSGRTWSRRWRNFGRRAGRSSAGAARVEPDVAGFAERDLRGYLLKRSVD